jgi:hypothetical protein
LAFLSRCQENIIRGTYLARHTSLFIIIVHAILLSA